MAVGRAERRRDRQPWVAAVFNQAQTSLALDLLELTDLAWHDCYREISPPREVVEDMLTVSDGTIEGLIGAARLAVTDWRDLRIAAQEHKHG